ncbi:hypothetical protein V8C86DRAFT_67765 [Haematococcus lacustris]
MAATITTTTSTSTSTATSLAQHPGLDAATGPLPRQLGSDAAAFASPSSRTTHCRNCRGASASSIAQIVWAMSQAQAGQAVGVAKAGVSVEHDEAGLAEAQQWVMQGLSRLGGREGSMLVEYGSEGSQDKDSLPLITQLTASSSMVGLTGNIGHPSASTCVGSFAMGGARYSTRPNVTPLGSVTTEQQRGPAGLAATPWEGGGGTPPPAAAAAPGPSQPATGPSPGPSQPPPSASGRRHWLLSLLSCGVSCTKAG